METLLASPQWWIVPLGAASAACTTLAFVPQIVKAWRHGARDLSYGMLLVYLVGVVLWLAYGLLVQARAVVAANAATAVLVGLVIVLKWRAEAAGGGPGHPRRRVAIDMDEVVADSLGKHLRLYNEVFGAELTPADLAGRSLEQAVPKERVAAVRELLATPGFFRDLEPLPESREVVRALCARHEVFIATAAMEVPTSFADKFAWLREHFPFIPPSHVVFCGDKAVLDVDYLIDDSPRHFARLRGTPVLFSAPHNRDETRYLRVSSWSEVRTLLLGGPPPAAAEAPPRLASSPAPTSS
jgi:5'(3')-deoxyribonucleotidase/uncharacterized protein with PQ loop repeat